MLPQVKTILYPTGLGSGAPFVFRYALGLAARYQARIVVVYGLEPIRSTGQAVVKTYLSDKQAQQAQTEARERIRADIRERIVLPFAGELEGGEAQLDEMVEIRVIDSSPHETVMHAAKAFEADMIVMGTHRHTVVKGTLLGNTALKVLHDATIPVVMVRIPEGYQDHDRGLQ